MTDIYIVRHCEAEGNNKRLFQGSTDCDITEMGEKQLELLKKRFGDIHLDIIYTSPLIRARKTALAIKGDREIPVVSDKGFTEIHGGVVEGKPFNEAFGNIPGLAEAWNNAPQDFAPEGGEPMRHAYERIWNAVLKVARENRGKTVAVATHGGVTRCLNCRLVFGTIERLKDMTWCENTGVTFLKFNDDLTPKIVFMNDVSHVPEELLPKRNRMVEVAKIVNNGG
ncbi:MAG: histidine phosphatase family protein [Clostridia bacterium]|nr:histidine phosphatase family protein [Clostridia bacterium]